MSKKSSDPFCLLCKTTLLCFGIILALSVILILVIFEVIPIRDSNKMPSIYYMNYGVSSLNDSAETDMLKYGAQLFNETPKFIGPDNGNTSMIYQGNRLACKNCHLNSGTKPYSAPLIGIIQRFPQFRGRENKIGTIEERINGCMERSMNGRMLPVSGKEMKAFVTYLEWLSRYAPSDGDIEGQGFLDIDIPNRAVNLENGKEIFLKNCAVCHATDGKGLKSSNSFTYEYPPLWGDDSYNHGAGMARVITAAQFIKANMPFGTTHINPVLSDEEAFDVAGYINQQQRPKKQNAEKDFPDIKKKPVSTPYPPYADNFSTEQHQLGPFQPIMDYYKKTFNLSKTK